MGPVPKTGTRITSPRLNVPPAAMLPLMSLALSQPLCGAQSRHLQPPTRLGKADPLFCLSDRHLFIRLWATKFRATVPLGAQVFRALGAGPKKQGVAQVEGSQN